MALLLLIFSSLFHSTSFAGDICADYKKYTPAMYKIYCGGGEAANPKPSGANSSFSESFKLNVAALPTKETTYGVEVMSTAVGPKGKMRFPTIGIVKGFSKFGTGASTSAANTFYSNDVYQRLNGPAELKDFDREKEKGPVNINVGTSFNVIDLDWLPSVSIGLSARYNQTTNTLGGGPALLVSGSYLGFGLGMSDEKVSNTLDRMKFYTAQASLRLMGLEIEYNYLFQREYRAMEPIHILTANFGIGDCLITTAVRRLDYVSEGMVTQFHFAAQYMLGRNFSFGYLYNYIPGGHTAGIQLSI